MIEVVVERRVREAAGVVSLVLAPLGSDPLPPWEAGAHVDVEVSRDVVRQYSLCSDPARPACYRIAVQHEPEGRGGSTAAHALEEGARLQIGSPRNLFALAPDARHSVLLAGGIGITPLLAMAYSLHAQGAPFVLHYSAPTRMRAAFLQELNRSPFASAVRLHFSEDGANARLDLAAAIGAPQPGGHIYACGPERYIDAVRQCAAAMAWPSGQVHHEHFAASATATAGARAFEIELARRQRVVFVHSDETIVDALAREGFEIPTSCEQGICGTCLTSVLAGTPDHRDMYLTDDEKAANRSMLPCCSRSFSDRLVIDL